MSELNHYAISRVLGSRIAPCKRTTFGVVSNPVNCAVTFANKPITVETLTRNKSRDRAIVTAFKAIHDGYSLDRVLADPTLIRKLMREVKSRGVEAPPALIGKRLFRIRKEGDPEVQIPRSTRVDARDYTKVLVASELAAVQIQYRFGASVDDMLADPQLGELFDETASSITPGFTSVDYRLGALYLRKNVRSRNKEERKEVSRTSVKSVEARWQLIGNLQNVAIQNVSKRQGVLSLREPKRWLYVSEVPNLQAGILQFQQPNVLAAVANRFWSPSLDSIGVGVISGEDVDDRQLRLFEMKALDTHQPLLNLLQAA